MQLKGDGPGNIYDLNCVPTANITLRHLNILSPITCFIFLSLFQSMYRLKKCSKTETNESNLTIDEVVERILDAVDFDRDGKEIMLQHSRKNYNRSRNETSFFLLSQVTLLWKSLLKVHRKIPGCLICWGWTWIRLDGFWRTEERVHISDVPTLPLLLREVSGVMAKLQKPFFISSLLWYLWICFHKFRKIVFIQSNYEPIAMIITKKNTACKKKAAYFVYMILRFHGCSCYNGHASL